MQSLYSLGEMYTLPHSLVLSEVVQDPFTEDIEMSIFEL